MRVNLIKAVQMIIISFYIKTSIKIAMFPFIFTISLSFIVIAFLTSKLQNDSTNLLISIYSALGPIETATIAMSTVIFITNGHPEVMIKILLFTALGFILLINLMGFIVQTPYLLADRKFLKWANRKSNKQESRLNLIWFHIISLICFFTSYKFKMILFSRLFNFECFQFQLEGIQKFKIFNVLSFIGYCPQILSLYCSISILAYSTLTLDELIVFIDFLIIIVINMAFSLVIIKKDSLFFMDKIDGIPINKVFNLVQEMNSATAMIEQRQRNKRKKNKTLLEDISQFDQFAYTSTKRDRNIKQQPFKIQKQKEQELYFEQTDSQKDTGSRMATENLNQTHLNHAEVGNAPPQVEQQIENILNIDEYYEDETIENHHQNEVQVINEPTPNQQPLQLHQTLPEIKQEIDNNQQDICQYQPYQFEQQEEPEKQTHIKVSQYLSQQNQQKEQLREYQQEFKQIDKSIDSAIQTEKNQDKFIYLINQSALIDSQPSNEPIVLTPHYQSPPNKYEEAKQMVRSVISAHHITPKKITKQIEDQIQMDRSNLFISNLTINQYHDQQPIKNKSIQKLKKLQNHPINPPTTNHPINGQRITKTEEEQSQQSQTLGKRTKTQTKQPTREPTQVQQAPFQHILIEDNQSEQPQVPRPKFYQQFFNQNQESQNSFKRSHPQSLALFSKKNKQNYSMVLENLASNKIPRQPIQCKINTFQTDDSSKQSTFILKRNFERAVKFSSDTRQRPMTSKQTSRFRNFSLDRKVIKGLQGKKMQSLEKIYLQRLNNF